MACTISNVQNTGMPGGSSKSFDVTVTAPDLTGCMGVRATVRDAADVPSDPSIVPDDATFIGGTQTQGLYHCQIMTNCTPGRVILAWPIRTVAGARANATV